ncbi:MAG: serine/threonine-protein phosphatase [Caldilineaceae bacterium]|nr:serine/threonine-protein phosphatase [Caldilineaceae bacterium]
MLQTTLTERLLEIGHATEAGVANQKNDDAYLIFPAFYLTDLQASKPVPVHVSIVADGDGEHGTGGVASQLAVEKMYSVLTESQTTPVQERISEAIDRANADIYQATQEDPTLSSMRSTVVVAAVVDSEAYFAHVGDCQAYVLRESTLWRLTRNPKNTSASNAPADAHNAGAGIGSALGEKATVSIDQLIVAPPELTNESAKVGVRVNRSWLPLQPQDTILLCSKGLTDVLEAESIRGVLELYPPQEAANQLMASVLAAGGADNATVVVMRWNGEVRKGEKAGFRLPRPVGIAIGALMVLLAVVVWWVLSSNVNVTQIEPDANTPEAPVLAAVTVTETAAAGVVADAVDTPLAIETPTVDVSSLTPESLPTVSSVVTNVVTSTVPVTPLESIAIVPTANAQPTSDGNLFITIEPPTAETANQQGTPAPPSVAEAGQTQTEGAAADLTATANVDSVRSAVAATLTALPTRTPTVAATATPVPTSTPTNVSTPRPTSTPTPDVAATQTAESQLLAASLAATMTAMPTATATATTDVAATETADAVRLATSIAATLAAQPTATPTGTYTPAPTDTPAATSTATATATSTPDNGATATAEAARLSASIAQTLTAQPTATSTQTNTPIPTATYTSVPTNTPQPTATATTPPTNTPIPTATYTPTADGNATATAEARRLSLSLAATLTARPTATPTNSATPTPPPTATPNVGATRTAEVRQLATSIAATLTARPTLTATRTPRPTSTPTVANTATDVATPTATTYVPPASNSVRLLSPAAGTTVDSAMRFTWDANFAPATGQGFELVFWKDGQDPIRNGFGLAAPTANTDVLIDLPNLDSRLGDLLEPGDYRWGILLVQAEPYQRLQYLGEGFAVHYARSGGGGSSGSSGGGVSSGE